MSYETLRFGWQKLLVNQVPQKGGRGYAPAAPPPDYAGQWQAAQNTLNSAQPLIQQTILSQAQIVANPAAAPEIVQRNNNELNAKISEIDGSINTVNSIPASVWEGTTFSKAEALNVLNTTRRNLAMCIGTVPSPPPPPQVINTVSNPVQSVQPTPPSGWVNSIDLPNPAYVPPQEIIQIPEIEFYPQQPSVVAGRGTWTCDGPILGTGTFTSNITRIRAKVDEVWAEDGNRYSSPLLVPQGLRYSYTRWKFTPEYVPPPAPPPVYVPQPVLKQRSEADMLRKQLEITTLQLQQLNRLMNKPIDPAPPEHIYPPTSWQYQFWQKGYSLKEVSAAEERASRLGLLDSTKGDFELFKLTLERILQGAILSGEIDPGIQQEIVKPQLCGLDGDGRPVIPEDLKWWLNPQPFQPQTPVISEPVREPAPPPVCALPMQFTDPVTQKPADPKTIPSALRTNRRFISSKIFRRPIQLEDIPQVATCSPNTVPTKGNWEDCLVGEGATVAELDTVRRCMAISKLQPNADMCTVAKNILITARNQVAIREQSTLPPEKLILPDLATTPYQPPAAPRPTNPFTLFAGNDMNSIPGVRSCGISAVNVVRSNSIARARTQQPRRGVLNSRNIKK